MSPRFGRRAHRRVRPTLFVRVSVRVNNIGRHPPCPADATDGPACRRPSPAIRVRGYASARSTARTGLASAVVSFSGSAINS